MAANAKGRRRVKGKTLDLNTFLGDDQDIAAGYAVVQPKRSGIDWADAMENEDIDDRFTLDYKKEEKVVLPTAPKAARGPDVDLSKVPSQAPFTAFLGNLPYDITDEDIIMFFRQLKVKNVRLPRENGDKGRIRGFGYAEFFNRQDLIQALALNNETLKNRAIKVTLAGEHDGDRDRRDGGVDRTLGDWRADKKDPFPRDESSRNDSFSSKGSFSDRDSYRGRSNYDSKDRFERNGGDRNDFSFRNDRDFGRDQDRRSNDRGYGFSSDRGMSRGGSGGSSSGGGGRRDFRESFTRRDDQRDSRSRDSERDYPPRDSYDRRPTDRPSYESSGPKERPKLQLAPRTKPIEPVAPPSEAVSSSSIFGGAKPVDTAAREREIEERLAKEKESVTKDPRERGDDRLRKFSTGSAVSNRSRRSSDSGPPNSYKDDEEQIPPYKPPIPRQNDQDTPPHYNTLPRTRQRNSSNSSGGSDRENQLNSKANHPTSSRKENLNSNYYAKSDTSDDATSRPSNDNSTLESRSAAGFKSTRNNHSYRDNSRERPHQATTYEEPEPPVYTSANKFSHLMADGEDLDQGSSTD